MAENPLLPSAELRALHSLLQQAVALAATPASNPESKAPKARSATPGLPGREALVSGTVLQLGSGDVLVVEAGDSFPAALLHSRSTKPKQALPSAPEFSPGTATLPLAAGMAAAFQKTSSDRLVLALVTAGTPVPHWSEALAWVQKDQLPLILACADPCGAEAFRRNSEAAPESFTWSSVQKVTAKLKLPVLSVDGEDAVAVYRVMQESILRARSGSGPAILWAMLPTSRELRGRRSPAASPLARLQHFMQTRNIQP